MAPTITELADMAKAMQSICCELDDEELRLAFQGLEERLRKPLSFVTVCGETSTGKSSLINGLLGRRVIPSSASPTNDTVVNINLQDNSELEFWAIYRNGAEETINEHQFKELVTSAPDSLQRIRVTLKPRSTDSNGLQIFDTPGYNSVINKHEEVLRSFLPQSDVVIFVTSYRAGFGQVDQDLLITVDEATVDDPEIPVYLVINRTPVDIGYDSKRVREIVSNARDCLQREPKVFLVNTFVSENEINPADRTFLVPKADELWKDVTRAACESSRLEVVQHKLIQLMKSLVVETDSVIQNRLLTLTSDEHESEVIKKQLALLMEARDKSVKLIHDRIKSITTLVPRLLRTELSRMSDSLHHDIDEANKWLGAEDCAQWITGHAFNYEGQRVGKSMESYLFTELDELNRELEDIANTAIQKIQATVEVRDTTKPDLGKKLQNDIAQRVAGAAVRGFLRNLGGACGVAAGAGNLAKMMVKRVGGLFGRRFGQPVYQRIGKAFNNKAIGRINAAINVVIEVATYLHHVKKWQGKLKRSVSDAVNEWGSTVMNDFSESYIPSITESNLESVHSVYDSSIQDIATAMASVDPSNDIRKLEDQERQIVKYRKLIDSYLAAHS